MLFCTTNRSYNVVYFERSDLRTLGIDPRNISSEDTKKLLRTALGSQVENIKTEIFPGNEGIIMFFKDSQPEYVFFQFETFEELLAASFKSPSLPSSLFYMDGKYILSVLSWDEEDLSLSLYEYGDHLDIQPDMLLFFEEHGKIIIEKDAIDKLTTDFTH